jgi:membrane protein EpsK
VLYLVMATGVGLWQVPYLIRHLGVAVYGQIGVLRSIVNYAALVTLAVTWTVTRFMSIELDRRRDEHANTCFNTAVFSLSGLCGILLVGAVIVRPFLPGLLKAPEGWEQESGRLFLLLILASCISSLRSPFTSVPFARHRFDLTNLFRSIGMAIQVTVIVACFTALPTRLVYVGWAYCLKEAGIFVGAIWLAVRLAPRLRISLATFRWRVLRDMAVMSLWSTVDRIGHLLYFSIDLILINLFLGNMACGRYAPMAQLAFLLSTFAQAVVVVFRPIAYEHIAHGKIDDLVGYAQRTTKFMALIIGLPVALACGLSIPGLAVWLGPEWSGFSVLLILLVGPMALNFAFKHLASITHGMNRVKAPAVMTVLGGLLNLSLSIVFLKYTDLGIYGVALATGISLTLRNACLMPVYCALVTNSSTTTFFRGIFPGLLPGAMAALFGMLVTRAFDIDSFPELAGAGCLLGLIYAGGCVLALDGKEFRFLFSLLGSRKQP